MWECHSLEFIQDQGVIEDPEGDLEMGNPYAVEAYCKCGHRWRLRGVNQIWDIPNFPR